MHQLIASPQQRTYLVARPGARRGIELPVQRYDELAAADHADAMVPEWLADAARRVWELDLRGQPMRGSVVVRPRTRLNYSRATWELNKGCNFNCRMCYLALRKFEGLPWPQKTRLIDMLCEAGVLWLQLTGGEPTIDRDFLAAYAYAYERGMLLEILTNGSRLHRDDVLDTLARLPPHKVTVSLYGASEATADSLTRTKGSFRLVMKGLDAVKGAGVPIEITIIITTHNEHELDAMRGLAHTYSDRVTEYGSISPTFDGQPDPLAAQSPHFLSGGTVFQGCPAGHTFFHVDPFGLATMCKVGRENPINLIETGVAGLLGLPATADAQMLRTGGCSGCELSGTCRVCRPMAKAYQKAKAPLENYCQHGGVPP
ncbi:radical SAM protein [Streptomyces sp. NPDC001868]|uniref:radical SAM protein n=1 Tax=Streptomyces sp. NPDC001868 TaxID=3154401 RepID=UPI00332961DB